MDFFKNLSGLEKSVRRNLEKAGEEKMGRPIIMGEESTESTDDSSSDLLGAIGVFSAAQRANAVTPSEHKSASPDASQDEVLEKSKKVREARAEARKTPAQKRADQRKKTPAAKVKASRARKAKAKVSQDKKGKKKRKVLPKTTKKRGESKAKGQKGRDVTASQKRLAEKKGGSGKGTGQAGRTGPRQRRDVGEVWFKTSGFHEGPQAEKEVPWTKRKDGVIERLSTAEQRTFKRKMKSANRNWKDGWDPEVEGKHWKKGYGDGPIGGAKKDRRYVLQMNGALGLDERIKGKSKTEALKYLKSIGIDLTEKQAEVLMRGLLSEAAYQKLQHGSGGPRRTPEQFKADFVDGMDKDNYKKADGSVDYEAFKKAQQYVMQMTPQQIEMLKKIISMDEDEDGLRDAFGIERYSREVHERLRGGASKSFEDSLEDILKGFC